MSETESTTPAAETATEEVKPTETVEFWKQKAREQEGRAKSNAAAAKRLAEIEESQKSEAEKVADRIAKAEQEVATVPAKVAAALRAHLTVLHGFDKEDAELFLTADDPDLLLKQAARLLERSDKQTRNHVPREGHQTQPTPNENAKFVRTLFGGGD